MTCNNIKTMQRQPRIKMDSRIDNMRLSCLKSYILDEFCFCASDTYSTVARELFKSFKRWYNTESVIVDIEPLYERVVWWIAKPLKYKRIFYFLNTIAYLSYFFRIKRTTHLCVLKEFFHIPFHEGSIFLMAFETKLLYTYAIEEIEFIIAILINSWNEKAILRWIN